MTEYDRAILSFCATFLLLLLLLLFSLSPVLSVFEVVASGWGSGRNSGANRIAALLIALVPLACRFSTHLFIYDFRFRFHKLISFFGGSLPLSDFFNFFFLQLLLLPFFGHIFVWQSAICDWFPSYHSSVNGFYLNLIMCVRVISISLRADLFRLLTIWWLTEVNVMIWWLLFFC